MLNYMVKTGNYQFYYYYIPSSVPTSSFQRSVPFIIQFQMTFNTHNLFRAILRNFMNYFLNVCGCDTRIFRTLHFSLSRILRNKSI
jgi:hypothetical protein